MTSEACASFGTPIPNPPRRPSASCARRSSPRDSRSSTSSNAGVSRGSSARAEISRPSPRSRPPAGTPARTSRTISSLAKLSPKERAEEYGLRPDRADVIVPAGAIFEYVAKRVRAREIWVPFVGLVDGVLVDVARAASTEGKKELEVSQTRNAVLALLKKYEVDARHAHR